MKIGELLYILVERVTPFFMLLFVIGASHVPTTYGDYYSDTFSASQKNYYGFDDDCSAA